MKSTKSGFTIVELLIVIVVIAILATISIVSYRGIQTRARASAIASDLKAAEKAFRAFKITSGASSWWLDSSADLTGSTSGNPSISSIIASQPDFRDFLQRPPTTNGIGTSNSWIYDNDGDTFNGCSASTAGVNLAIQNVTNVEQMQVLDEMIDDGNLSCGVFHASGSTYLYTLSNSST